MDKNHPKKVGKQRIKNIKCFYMHFIEVQICTGTPDVVIVWNITRKLHLFEILTESESINEHHSGFR